MSVTTTKSRAASAMPEAERASGGRGRWWRLAGLSLLSAVLLTTLWPPFGLWPLAFVAIAPLAIAAIADAREPRSRRAGVCFALIVLLTQSLPWGVAHAWMMQLTPPGKVLLDLYCAAYVALFALLLRRVARSPRAVRLPMAFLLPVLWVGCEFLRTTVVLGGYPWYPLGMALSGGETSNGWCALSASIIGTFGLSSLPAMTAGALVDLLRWRAGGGRRVALVGGATAIAAFLLNAAIGWWLLASTTTAPGATVLVVETDLSVSNKNAWSKEDQEADTVRYIQATLAGARAAREAGRPFDLVAWPETMVPGFGLEPETIRMLAEGRYYPGAMYATALADLARELRAPFLVGSPVYLGLRPNREREVWEWDRHHNSAYLIDGEPPYARYDKLVLTPMGEEMPLISRWEWLEKQLLALGAPGMSFDLMPGEGPVRFDVPWVTAPPGGGGARLRFATPICFEDTVPSLCRLLCYHRGERQVDLMVNLSNDGWFGWSIAGRSHHLHHARMRSIELAMPMVRCANTGDSVAIEWNGRVSDRVRPRNPAQPAVGTGTMVKPLSVERCDRVTIYARVGDLWSWVSLGLMVALLLWTRRVEPAQAA